MRSPKAVNRPHTSCYLRNRVQNKKRSVYASRQAVAIWIATTPCTEPKKCMAKLQEPVQLKEKKPKAPKAKKEKNSAEKTPKVVEEKIEVKNVGSSAAEKKAEQAAKKEQEKKEKAAREALKREEEQRRAEELKKQQAEEAERKKVEKQRRREEEEAKAQAAKERKEREAELKVEEEKQKAAQKAEKEEMKKLAAEKKAKEDEEKKRLAAEKKAKEEEEKKRVAAEKQAQKEEAERKRKEAEAQKAEEEKKRIAEEQAAIELKEKEERERLEREQQAAEEAQRLKEISDRQLAEEKAAAERKAREEEEEKKRISELQAEVELRELEEKQKREEAEAKQMAEQKAQENAVRDEAVKVQNGKIADETVAEAIEIKDHAEQEANKVIDAGAADAIHTHAETVSHEHKNESKKNKNKKNKKKNANSVSEEEHVQKKVVQNEGSAPNKHEDVVKVENGKIAKDSVAEAIEIKDQAEQESNKVLDEGAADAIHTHKETVNHPSNDKKNDKKSKNKKNKKKSGTSVSEEDHVEKKITHDDQAQSSSNGTANTGKDVHQELAVDVNTSSSLHETSHTKCSIDSGVDVTDFSTGKKSKKGKKGQQSVSDASLSSTKSSSNESISELPENGISPKTPTSTPVNESMVYEHVVVNGTEATNPIKEQSPTKFAQQVAEFVTQAQQVIVSQKATSQPLRHIKIEPIVPLVLPPKIERNPRRERVYKLLPRDIEYCAYMMETYGEDYDSMSKDKRNIYMDSASSLRRKIRIFHDSPQYELYLKAKEEGRPIESIC